jgi:ankyrin repeat protein
VWMDVNLHKNAKGYRALHASVLRGHTAITRLLVAGQADLGVRCNIGATPLQWASARGNLACLEVLIESKADVKTATEGVTPDHFSVMRGYVNGLQLLVQVGCVGQDQNNSNMKVSKRREEKKKKYKE